MVKPLIADSLEDLRNQPRVTGTGSCLPDRRLSNDDLCGFVDTSDEWITARVGIKSRHISDSNEGSVELAARAAERALEAAGLQASDIDLIIFATITPDKQLPSAAALLQKRLSMPGAMAFDIQAACSGFLFGMAIADSMICTLGFKHALIVGSETLSKIVDWTDRNTCVLFGDGAGAAILSKPETPTIESMLLSTRLVTQGTLSDLICRPGGSFPLNSFPGASQEEEASPYMVMQGPEVYKTAVASMSESIESVLQGAGKTINDVDYFIPHQSNKRMIQAVCQKVGLNDESKVILNIERVGNTSAASIPIAFDEAVRDGRIQPGSLLLMTAVGAGMTYGSILFEL